MKQFDFPYHRLSDEYPESSKSLSFGGGYSFASAPKGPDQITFHLDFEAVWFWFTIDGVPNSFVQPSINALRLQEFYEEHRMYKPFLYLHQTKGRRVVRFLKPLPRLSPIPEKTTRCDTTLARGHQVQPFSIQLIDNP